MKISEDNLVNSLKEKLLSIYVVLGAESAQIEENLDKIYNKSKMENFTDKETHVIGKQTEWDFLKSGLDNLDLFEAKKIVEIKLLEQGPGVKGARALKEYALEPDPNILLIVIGEGLDRKSYSSAWVKALEEAGALISIQPLSSSAFISWIQEKGKTHGVTVLKEAALLLADQTEKNLMATLQEINKLSLIYPNQEIDLKRMKKTIANSSRFTVFDFSNAFISGNKKKAIRILESLKAEGAPETLVLWALSRELENLFKVSQTGTARGIRGPAHYLEILEKSAKRIPKKRILKAFKEIAQVDSSIKGLDFQNPWLGLRELTLTF